MFVNYYKLSELSKAHVTRDTIRTISLH